MSKSDRRKSNNPTRTFSFVSLGCPKNTVDSERMLGLLTSDGYALVPESAQSDVVIVNTCGFIEASRQESLTVIRDLVARKNAGQIQRVVVAGCLAERYKDQLLEEVPGIDHVMGVHAREEVVRVVDRLMSGLDEQRSLFQPAPIRAQDDRARLRITPKHLAFLKVSEGCDRLCTFCAIPGMRGKHVTKPIEMVVDEARELARDGVRELNLVAQDMTYYGVDLYGEPRLAALLRELSAIPELDWIRVLYNYPMYFTDELYETLANTPKILPYLDMPIQHINDRMLRLMNRRHTHAQTEEIVGKLRATIPNLVLRTTFIVGFPGETDAEFEELLAFVQASRFERLGVFTYSIEPGTPAERLKDHLPEDVKTARQDAIMKAQQGIAFAFQESLVGKTLDVLIDAPCPDDGRLMIGRSYADAPDVDGLVYLPAFYGKTPLNVGDLVPCSIVAAQDYDLVAQPNGAPVPPAAASPARQSKESGKGKRKRIPAQGLEIL